MMQASADKRHGKWRKLSTSLLVGAVVGFAGAWAAMGAAKRGMLGTLSNSQEIALLVAVLYLLMGIAVGVGLLAPRLGSKFLNVEDAEELSEQRAMLVPSALSCLALAFGLGVLALAGAGGMVQPGLALGLFLGSLAAGTWLSIASMRHADELMREVMRDGAAASFYLAFAGIGGWALLGHLGFASGPGMLDIVTLFYALTLAGCFWVVGRRGMLMR